MNKIVLDSDGLIKLMNGDIHEKPIALNVVKGFHVEKLQFPSAGQRLSVDMDNSLDKTDR